MSTDYQETRGRVLVKLKSMRTHLDKTHPIGERYVIEYHAELQRLQDIGDDISDFRISQSDVKPRITSVGMDGPTYSEEKYVNVALMLPILETAISYIESLGSAKEINALDIVDLVLKRFHQIARQLRSRYDSRPTLDVRDEYDVQDLLHALLKMHFDDIRTEEWTPSYAGGSARMDFLIKEEHLVIETKRTSNALRDRKIGEQLIVDIAKYKQHPDCNTLVCFVYDPEGLISNPTGLENDLQRSSSDDFDVRTFVYPK